MWPHSRQLQCSFCNPNLAHGSEILKASHPMAEFGFFLYLIHFKILKYLKTYPYSPSSVVLVPCKRPEAANILQTTTKPTPGHLFWGSSSQRENCEKTEHPVQIGIEIATENMDPESAVAQKRWRIPNSRGIWCIEWSFKASKEDGRECRLL